LQWLRTSSPPRHFDLKSTRLVSVFKTGPAAAEGGVTATPENVWLVIDKQSSLARIDLNTGIVRQITHLPAGSYNPIYSDGQIWVTHVDGSEVTGVDAATGAIFATVPTGPGPPVPDRRRFRFRWWMVLREHCSANG
jgi:hypothetical protein